MAKNDGLTGLYNRRYFDHVLNMEWYRSQRQRSILSIILADIDFFKNYNDKYGHIAGDKCLQNVADAFKRSIRRVSDVAVRFGGEEFAVILPDTDSDGAVAVAQTIKDSIERMALPHEASLVKATVSLSFGVVSSIPDNSLNCELFIKMADKALYQSKENGRDMISTYK